MVNIIRLIWIVLKLIDMLKDDAEKKKARKELLSTAAEIVKEEEMTT